MHHFALIRHHFNLRFLKMLLCCFVPVAGASLFCSCSFTTPTIQHSRPVPDYYKFHVTDENNMPVEGTTITSTLYDHGVRKIDTMLTTGKDGDVVFTILAVADTVDQYQNAFDTKCEYTAVKTGYMPDNGSLSISYFQTDLNARGYRGLNEKSETITLLSRDNLVSSSVIALADNAEKDAILRFAENLHRTFNSRGMTVAPHSIQIFLSDEGILTAAMATPNVMNVDVLDSAGIAKIFFDIAGREAIELLRAEAGHVPDISKFTINLAGTKKHFNSSTDDPVPVRCSFTISKSIFTKYSKNDLNEKLFSQMIISLDGKSISVQE